MLQIVMEWNLVPQFITVTGLAHVTSPRKTQFKSVLLAGKIMAALFWVEKGYSYELFPWGTVVNSECYIESLRRLNACFHWICPTRNTSVMFLLHDNGWLPTSVGTTEAIMKALCIVLAHPPCSPDLTLSHFHLSGSLQEAYEDTFMCMMGYCRMPHSSHCSGQRPNSVRHKHGPF